MAVIPQRTLRNEIGEILRRAEAGEQIVVTVAGRPVAQLGPVPRSRTVPGTAVRAALSDLAPTHGLLDDLRQSGGGITDPFST